MRCFPFDYFERGWVVTDLGGLPWGEAWASNQCIVAFTFFLLHVYIYHTRHTVSLILLLPLFLDFYLFALILCLDELTPTLLSHTCPTTAGIISFFSYAWPPVPGAVQTPQPRDSFSHTCTHLRFSRATRQVYPPRISRHPKKLCVPGQGRFIFPKSSFHSSFLPPLLLSPFLYMHLHIQTFT